MRPVSKRTVFALTAGTGASLFAFQTFEPKPIEQQKLEIEACAETLGATETQGPISRECVRLVNDNPEQFSPLVDNESGDLVITAGEFIFNLPSSGLFREQALKDSVTNPEDNLSARRFSAGIIGLFTTFAVLNIGKSSKEDEPNLNTKQIAQPVDRAKA